MKKRKQAGKGRKSVSESDETVAKVLAACRDLTEVAENIIAYRVAHPIVLSVPDAQTEKEFLENARQVYRAAHPPHLKPGRPSEENLAIDHLMRLSDELGPQPTQGAMIKSLKMLNLSENTAVRYARLYKLYCLSTQDIALFSQVDKQWLCKEFGAESLSPAWWDNRFWQWFRAKVTSSELGEEIRRIFAGEYTETELRQMQSKMVMLQQERYALSRQQADVTIAKDGRTKEPRPRPKRSRKSPG